MWRYLGRYRHIGTAAWDGRIGNGHMGNGQMGNGHMGNGHMGNGHMGTLFLKIVYRQICNPPTWRFPGGALCHVALPGWRFPGLPMWRFLSRKRHIGQVLGLSYSASFVL